MYQTLPHMDERLKAVMNLVPACDTAADIGADHGRLSCNLLYSGKVKKIVISDISDISLHKAEVLIAKHEMKSRVTFKVGDGLSVLDSPVDTIIICGMGGENISEILESGRDRIGNATLLLCPQTDIMLVRQTICNIGHHITDEEIVFSNGRYYVIIKAEKGIQQIGERALFLGPVLEKKRDQCRVTAYYRWRLQVESKVRKAQQEEKLEWLREMIDNAESK